MNLGLHAGVFSDEAAERPGNGRNHEETGGVEMIGKHAAVDHQPRSQRTDVSDRDHNGCRLGSNVRLKTATSPVLRGMRTNVVNKSNRILNISNSAVFADAAAGVVEDRKVVVTKETLRTVGSLRSAEGIMRHFITR